MHCWFRTVKLTVKDCCKIVPFWTSRWTVKRTFNLMEWGSVQIHPASTKRIFCPLLACPLSPLTCARQSPISSRLSSSQATHFPASLCHRWQPRHWCKVASVLIPRVISEVLARHVEQVLAAFGSMSTPHMQHSTLVVEGGPPALAATEASWRDVMVTEDSWSLPFVCSRCCIGERMEENTQRRRQFVCSELGWFWCSRH